VGGECEKHHQSSSFRAHSDVLASYKLMKSLNPEIVVPGHGPVTTTMFQPAGRKSNEPGLGLSGFDFASIKAPVLFVHHVGDQCEVTPYSDAARLADRYPLVSVFGGDAPQSGRCDAFSQHGFFGKEAATIAEIVNWRLKKPFRTEVK
jgi:hypothetical protein